MLSHSDNSRINVLDVKISSLLEVAATETVLYERFYFSEVLSAYKELTNLYRNQIDQLNRRVLELDKQLLFMEMKGD